jgi:hypothetical protein
VGVLRLPRLRNARFHGGGLRDDRTWREGVLSLKQGRCNETNQYHPTQQSPHENDWLPGNENPHGRTSGDESGSRITAIVPRKPSQIFVNIALVVTMKVRVTWGIYIAKPLSRNGFLCIAGEEPNSGSPIRPKVLDSSLESAGRWTA